MAAVTENLADFVMVTSDNPRTEDPQEIIRQIMAGFKDPDPKQVAVEPDRKKAIETVLSAARKGDIVLIAGKGHETYQIIGRQKSYFSDQAVALEYLGSRR